MSVPRYNLNVMDDRLKLIKSMVSRKGRNLILWMIERRYGREESERTKEAYLSYIDNSKHQRAAKDGAHPEEGQAGMVRNETE